MSCSVFSENFMIRIGSDDDQKAPHPLSKLRSELYRGSLQDPEISKIQLRSMLRHKAKKHNHNAVHDFWRDVQATMHSNVANVNQT